MTSPTQGGSRRERTWIYVTACVLLGVLVLVALLTWREGRENARAREKADEMVALLQENGVASPDRDRIIRVLGDDGGATCADPNEALNRAVVLTLLTNGATGPGIRPVVADSRAVRGQVLIMQVYCPDELDEFREFVDDLKTDEHVKD